MPVGAHLRHARWRPLLAKSPHQDVGEVYKTRLVPLVRYTNHD